LAQETTTTTTTTTPLGQFLLLGTNMVMMEVVNIVYMFKKMSVKAKQKDLSGLETRQTRIKPFTLLGPPLSLSLPSSRSMFVPLPRHGPIFAVGGMVMLVTGNYKIIVSEIRKKTPEV
jgi:hypothetical protein